MKISTFHASTRFGLGAREGELKHIGSSPKGWLTDQLKNAKIPKEVQERYGGKGLMGETIKDIKKKKIQQGEKKIKLTRDVYIKETGARVLAHVRSEQPFIERLVMFWSNHFTVSIQKPIISGIVNQYEVEAIRPHVNGYFKDMLLAVSQHPAMLFYLDNIQSFGPNSTVGVKRGKGLNENLAREILELHTLGVDGGYRQKDVIELAKIITGWTLDRGKNGAIIKYRFQPSVHEPGEKKLLGRKFKEEGEQEGVDALTMLATHPSTAKHIATKLATHFISDKPSAHSINVLARSFINSGGHLPTVMKTLINMPEVWKEPLVKLNTPYEYVISALRLTGIEPSPKKAIKGLEALNYRAFNASSPAGYDDVAASWASPDAIMKRVEWGHKLAQLLPAGTDPIQLANAGLGAALSPSTKQTIERAASGVDGIGFLLASPEFQRR